MLRVLDIFFSLLGLLLLFPIMIVIFFFIFFDTGSPIFLQERVGRYKKPFVLIKFRTMKLGTPSVASHLSKIDSITWFGSILRKTKLDELPQLFNVLRGHMSIVGPRPGLFNQTELIKYRDQFGVYNVKPGITGLAQVEKIDMSTPKLLAEVDGQMIKDLSFKNYLHIILMTIVGKGYGDRINKKN